MPHDNPDQQPSDRPEPTRQESESAPSRVHQIIYASKETGMRAMAAGTAFFTFCNPVASPLLDNGNSRPQGTTRDNGAEVARPHENTACRPMSQAQIASRPPGPEIGIDAQPAPEKAVDAKPSDETPEQPHPADPEFHEDPDNSPEEPGKPPNGWSDGDLEARPK